MSQFRSSKLCGVLVIVVCGMVLRLCAAPEAGLLGAEPGAADTPKTKSAGKGPDKPAEPRSGPLAAPQQHPAAARPDPGAAQSSAPHAANGGAKAGGGLPLQGVARDAETLRAKALEPPGDGFEQGRTGEAAVSETAGGAGGADDCPATPLGVLTSGAVVVSDTTGAADDFGQFPDCLGGCGFYTSPGGAPDVIFSFSVDAPGEWTIAACSSDYDNALSLRSGGACPGITCLAADDDGCTNCLAPFQAKLTACLAPGVTYYLIVDGWSKPGTAEITFTLGGAACDGGCCFESGACQDATSAGTCAAAGGEFAGSGTACLGDNDLDGFDDLCTPPSGACCHSGGICTDNVFESQCSLLSGLWHPNGSCFDPGFTCQPACVFNNGPPIDDLGSPASQYSAGFPIAAGAADDFVLTGLANACRMTSLRAWTSHFNEAAGPVDPPVDYQAVNVTIYRDDAGNPAGRPVNDGSHQASFTGGIVYTQVFATSEIAFTNEGAAAGCTHERWRLDIPVDIVLDPGVGYWLEVQPVMNSQLHPTDPIGQVVMVQSNVNYLERAQRIFPEAGVTDWIEIAGNTGACPPATPPAGSRRGLAFDLVGQGLSVPANDDCAQAAPISGGVVSFDTSSATTDGLAHEACLAGGNAQISNDVWFEYVAECTGELTVSTCDQAAFDTRLAVYEGCGQCAPGNDELLGCNDDDPNCAGFTSRVQVEVTAGQCYTIRAGGFDLEEAGSGLLSVTCSSEPCAEPCAPGSMPEGEPPCTSNFVDVTNGGCGAAQPAWSLISPGDQVCGRAGTFTGGLPSMTRDTDWYRFTLVEERAVEWCVSAEFEVQAGIIDDQAGACTAPVFITSDTGIPCEETCARVCLPPGTYSAFVAPVAFSGVPCSAMYNARLNTEPCSLGASCGNSELVEVGAQHVRANHGGWFRFVAGPGPVTAIDTCGSDFDTVIEVYGDAGCEQLLATNDDCSSGPFGADANPLASCFDPDPGSEQRDSCVCLQTVEGTSYKVRVGSFGGPLTLNPPPVPSMLTLNISEQAVCSGEGACCLPDGSCLDGHSVVSCEAAGGDHQGASTLCGVVDCPVCGDGATEGAEECDDSNTNPGDGCSPVCTIEPQSNDSCAGADPISDGLTPFTTLGATTDGPVHLPPSCDEGGFGDPTVNQDIWFDYTATCSGTLTVSTCNDGLPETGEADFDTKIAIYEGCDCPVGELDLLVCNDDGLTCAAFSSIAQAEVEQGACYKLRVGGYTDESGSGVLSVFCGEPPPRGGCCLKDVCTLATAADCAQTGGTYLGDDSDCDLGVGQHMSFVANVNQPIPDNEPVLGVSHTIQVGPSFTIGDVDISLAVSHSYIGDLVVTVEHGPVVAVIDRPGYFGVGFGCPSNDLLVVLDDEGDGGPVEALCGVSTADTTPASPPNYTPNDPLSAFDGLDSAGPWTIRITDNAADDLGVFLQWSVRIDQLAAIGPCDAGCPEATADECCDTDPANGVLDDVCVWCACDPQPFCNNVAKAFPADVGGPFGSCMPDGFCNLFDRAHVLTCFAGTNNCPSVNIDAGGAFGICQPDGTCNLFDAVHALTCFEGMNTCTCQSPQSSQASSAAAESATVGSPEPAATDESSPGAKGESGTATAGESTPGSLAVAPISVGGFAPLATSDSARRTTRSAEDSKVSVNDSHMTADNSISNDALQDAGAARLRIRTAGRQGASASDARADARTALAAGGLLDLEIWLEPEGHGLADLRGYQLHIAALPAGAARGRLEVHDLRIEQRPGGVFAESAADTYEAFNVSRGQMLAGLDSGSAEIRGPVYLGTVTLSAPTGTSGVFIVDVLHDQAAGDQTFLVATPNRPITITTVDPAVIEVQP